MSQKDNVMLEIKDLNKNFGKSHIIKNLNLSINSSEVFGFLGPNGSGKTTTIKMVVGLLSIDSGEVFVNGVNIKKDFEKALSYIGAIVENPDMYEYLSGYDNLVLKARLFNVSKERISQVVELVGLTDRIKDKVKKYSLGMKQRLGLAQALLHNPKLLILDEPTNGLDPAGIKELRTILKNLAHKEGVAVFVSSHLLSEMELMCDRVAVISKGEVIKVNTIEEVLNSIENESKETEVNQNLHTYFLNVDNVEKTVELLEEDNIKILDKTSNLITIELEKENIPVLNKKLIQNDVLVYSIEQKKKSLEESFLNITKEGGKNV